jgi:hypothetical protein
MDGNGRWAAARGLPRVEGHRRGVEALRRTIRAAGEIGIQEKYTQRALSESRISRSHFADAASLCGGASDEDRTRVLSLGNRPRPVSTQVENRDVQVSGVVG